MLSRKMKLLPLFFIFLTVLNCSKSQKPITIKPMENQNAKVNPYYSRTDKSILNVPDSEWKTILSPEVYEVAREAGTERPGSGKYYLNDVEGEYYCTVCGNHLFHSSSKFASSCGWPSFFEADKDGVKYRKDISHGMNRIEVLCKRCSSHLGHVFNDGPEPTGIRFCMNSICLDFEPKP